MQHQFQERIQPIGFYPLPTGPAQPGDLHRRLCEEPKPTRAEGHVLYLHVPFCHQRCAFCFFFENLYRDDLWTRYFAALKSNLAQLASQPFIRGLRIDAIFFGGGSPNVFAAHELEELLGSISSGFNLKEGCEITMEWYPTDMSRSKLQTAYDSGVTRLSFGIQAFSPERSKLLRLTHTLEQSREIIENALEIGFKNVNIDLITCLPGETKEELENELLLAHSFHGGGISVNPLEFIPTTPLQVMSERGKMPEKVALEKKLAAISLTNQTLKELGYVQQRFFNFHLPGKQHLYNHLSARPFCNIIAAGPGAYGIINDYVYVNHKSLESYLTSVEQGELPVLSGSRVPFHELKLSYIVTSLLEMELYGDEYARAFGARLEDDFGDVLESQTKRGLIAKVGDDKYALTEFGALWGDNVCFEYYSDEQAGLLDLRFANKSKKQYGFHYAPTAAAVIGK
jgi:oxygen-independent coproporphyrinogen-3 oxidase